MVCKKKSTEANPDEFPRIFLGDNSVKSIKVEDLEIQYICDSSDKILGVTIDKNLIFSSHIQKRKLAVNLMHSPECTTLWTQNADSR